MVRSRSAVQVREWAPFHPVSRDKINHLGRYSSGQRGQTVNLLALAYGGSNPSRPTIISKWFCARGALAFGEESLPAHHNFNNNAGFGKVVAENEDTAR